MTTRRRVPGGSILLVVSLVGACSGADDTLLDAARGDAVASADAERLDARPVAPGARKRIYLLRNGTLGKIRDSSDPRTGLETADAACTLGADAQGLGGTWTAWLSSSAIDAIDRISDVGPWYRVDQEQLLFASRAELALGPRIPIDVSDPDRATFWSGTGPDGRRTGDTCQDWTEYVAPLAATVGRTDVAGAAWVNNELLECSTYLALLCVEQ